MTQHNGTDLTEYLIDQQPGLAVVLRQKIGSDNTHYIHAPRGIASQHDGAGWSDAIADGLGSVRGWIDSAQAFGDIMYDPYGVADASVNGFGFTGEMTDDNGLVYLRARYYQPSIGMFTALDPFEGVHGRPMSMNGYSWVEGNVANWVDPTGMETLSQCYQDCYENPCHRDNEQDARQVGWIGCPYFFTNTPGLFCDPFTGFCDFEDPYSGDKHCPQIGFMPYHPEFQRCLLTRCDQIHKQPIHPPKFFTVGTRFDFTGAVPLAGIDINVELYCMMPTILNFECGWFANINREIGSGIGTNLNVGLLGGLISYFPNPGDVIMASTGGGTLNQMFIGLEADLTINQAGDVVLFIGRGGGPNLIKLPSGYVGIGASVYLGKDILNIPEHVHSIIREVAEYLLTG